MGKSDDRVIEAEQMLVATSRRTKRIGLTTTLTPTLSPGEREQLRRDVLIFGATVLRVQSRAFANRDV